MNLSEIKIAVIGLGYVGLPLARLFSTKYKTVGFDMNAARCAALMAGHDATLEVSDELLQDAINNHGFVCTADIEQIRDCNFYVVAVPTPVDENNNPDLTPLYGASTTIGKVISKGDIVVYESTVYPGVTEDECLPVVEKVSGLKFNVDFYAGYSPERINPGDKLHTVEKIKKVTSGSTPEIGRLVDDVYSSVITAGTHLAPTIKVAEASKVIENSTSSPAGTLPSFAISCIFLLSSSVSSNVAVMSTYMVLSILLVTVNTRTASLWIDVKTTSRSSHVARADTISADSMVLSVFISKPCILPSMSIGYSAPSLVSNAPSPISTSKPSAEKVTVPPMLKVRSVTASTPIMPSARTRQNDDMSAMSFVLDFIRLSFLL